MSGAGTSSGNAVPGTTAGPTRLLRHIAPTLHGYQRGWLGRDAVAGVVLSALLVPQGMAYAELAGLPAVTGLYTSILCLLGYAVAGPSRILVLGPDSSLGPMIAAIVLPLAGAGGDPAKAIMLASALALITGAIMVAAGLADLGFVADLLSKPTILGYVNGLALTIMVGQLPKLLGFSVDADTFGGEVAGVVSGIANGDVLAPAAAIGLLSLLVILVLSRRLPKIPAVLVAVVLAIGLSIAFDLGDAGVSLIGVLPQGLPALTWPAVGLADLAVLAVGAMGIALVALGDTISTATTFAERHGQRVDGNKEMVGIGVANISAGLFQGFPVSTSGSRTAVAESSRSKTQLTGVVGAVVIAVMLLALPGLFADLPQPTLAAVVIAAALTLADVAGTRRLYHQRRTDFVVSIVAFLGVTVLGVLPGLVLAVVLSVANVFRRAWRPYRAELGRPRDVGGLHDLLQYPDADVLPGCAVLRFDAPLIFANASTFRDLVLSIADRDPPPSWIVVAAEPITDIDTTACDMLEDLVPALDQRDVRLVLAELKSPARARLDSYDLSAVLDADRFYPTLTAAVDDYRTRFGASWQPPAAPPTKDMP
jgi:high affinity sulfate transporter 1